MILFLCACLWAVALTSTAGAQGANASMIDRSEVLGAWEGVIGTRSRNATLLRFRLTLKTGLESPGEPEPALIMPDEEEQAALEEARARTKAIREGRDPEDAVSAAKASRSSGQSRAKAIGAARLQRERNRSDRVEGTLEFSPLYGEGEIRTGLGGVPSVEDASGSCEVVGYLNTHSGTLTIKLTRWAERPKVDLLRTNELQLVVDPAEPVLFGESAAQLRAYTAFNPVIAWREGRAPEDEIGRIEAVAYPNRFGGDRIKRLRRDLSEYTRSLENLERKRPIDTIEADFAHRYLNAENRLSSQIASQQNTYEKTLARYDEQEAALDEQEAADDVTDSQLRRIASKRESIAARRKKAAEKFESRKAKAHERYNDAVADVDERVEAERAKLEEALKKHNAQREALEATRSDVQRTIQIDNEVVASWVERIAEAHPEIRSGDELDFSGPGARHAIQNALRDDVFAEVFGAPYDELTDYDMLLLTAYFDMRNEQYDDEGELRAETGASTPAPRSRGRVRRTDTQDSNADPAPDHSSRIARQRDEQRKLLDGGSHAVKAPFTDDYEQNLLRLYVQRRTLNWIQRVGAKLGSIQADADTFERIDAVERALALRTHHLRPSEQDDVVLLTINARREHADATARHLATRLANEASGQAGIAALSYFWASHPSLDRLVADRTREEVNTTIDAGLDRAIVKVVQDLSGRIETLEGLTDPYEALALGAEIYREFVAQIGGAKRRPSAQRILKAIAARRPRDLVRVHKEVNARILAADSAQEARRIASTVVTLPSDSETDAGKLMLLNVSLRALQLEAEAIKALFSEREWALLDQERGRLVVPENYSAPSAEEVRLATLRALASDGGKVLDPSTCMHVVPGLGNLNMKLRMELRDVHIVSATQRADGAYDVMYTFRRRITPEGSLASFANDDFWQGTLLLDMLDAFGDNLVESSFETFLLGPHGWCSPTLAARLDLASAMQPLRVLSGERRDR